MINQRQANCAMPRPFKRKGSTEYAAPNARPMAVNASNCQVQQPGDMGGQSEREHGPQNNLKCHKRHTQVVNRAGEVRLVLGVEVTVGEAVDHVSESEQKKENEDAFPERLRFEGSEVLVYQQGGHRDDGDLGDTELDAAYEEQVADKIEEFRHHLLIRGC
jgi:hypothetical protein